MAQRRGGGDTGAVPIFIRGFRASGGRKSGNVAEKKPNEASSGNHRAGRPSSAVSQDPDLRTAGGTGHWAGFSLAPATCLGPAEATQQWRAEEERTAAMASALAGQAEHWSVGWTGPCVCMVCMLCLVFSPRLLFGT